MFVLYQPFLKYKVQIAPTPTQKRLISKISVLLVLNKQNIFKACYGVTIANEIFHKKNMQLINIGSKFWILQDKIYLGVRCIECIIRFNQNYQSIDFDFQGFLMSYCYIVLLTLLSVTFKNNVVCRLKFFKAKKFSR